MSSPALRPGPAPADHGQYVEFERFIDRRIQQTRGQVKFVDLASGLLVWLSASVLFLLGAALADAWIWPGGLPGWGRFGLWTLALVGSLWYLGTRVAPLVLRRINPLYAAAAIERGKPTLKNSVVNFLLLRDAQGQVPSAVFEGVEQQAAAGLAHAPAEESVDRSILVRLGYVLLGTVLLACLYTVASPKDPLRTVARVLLPWADIPPPARVTLLSVLPGDAEAFHGQQLEVTVEAEGAAAEALLVYTTADGTRVDHPIPLHRAEGDYRYKGELPETESGLQQDLLYHVQVGDARSPRYRVKVLATPTITVESVEYQYPAYTGLATQRVEKQGDIEALEGTKVVIRASANGDIKTAHIDLGSDNRFDQPLKFDGREAELTMPLAIPPEHGPRPYFTNYELRFTNTAGHSTRQPIRHSLAVTPDLPPEVRFLQPLGTEVEVPENAAVILETSAIDPDFALRRVVLEGRKNEQPLFEQKLLDEVRSGQFGNKFTFAPARYKLAAGDEVLLQAKAEDNRVPKPGVGRSTELLIHIVAADPRAKPQSREGEAGGTPPPDEQRGQPQRNRDPQRGPGADNEDQEQRGDQPQDRQTKPQQPERGKAPQQREPKQGDENQGDQNDPGQQQDQQSGEGGQEGGAGGQSRGKQAGSGSQQEQGAESGQADDRQQAQGGESGKGQQGGQQGGNQGKSGDAAGDGAGKSGSSGAEEPVTNDGDAYEKILDHLKQNDDKQGQSKQGEGQQDGKQSHGQNQVDGQKGGQQNQGGEQGDAGEPAETGQGNDQQGKNGQQGGAGEKGQQRNQSGQGKQKPTGGEKQADGGEPEDGQRDGKGEDQAGKNAGAKSPGRDRRPQPGEGKQGGGAKQEDGAGEQDQAGADQGANEQAGKDQGGKQAGQRPRERASDAAAKGGAGEGDAGKDSDQGGAAENEQGKQGSGAGQNSQQPGGKQGQRGQQGQAGDQAGAGEDPAGKSQPGERGQSTKGSSPGGKNSPDTTPEQNGGDPQSGGKGEPKRPGQTNERPQNEQDPDSTGQAGDTQNDPATGENGQSGAGRPDQGQGGSPQAQGQNQPKSKDQRGKPDSKKRNEGDSPRGASDSNKQSDTQGDGDTGQQSGGGKTGGGQAADNQGKGSAGENTPDDEGAGRSQEQGPGETGEGPGQQDEASKPTGESSKTGQRGEGSKSAPGNRGQQPGKSPPDQQNPGGPAGDGKTQPGQGRPGQPNSGTQGEPTTQPPGSPPPGPRDAGQEPGGDEANLEYADKATDLVLDRLRNDLNKGKTDPELLRKLGWSKNDLAKFVRRWEEMKRAARTPDAPAPQARRELDAALRSLGLTPAGAKVGSSATGDVERGLRESRSSQPPAEFQDAFRAYTRGLSGGKSE